jgi:predicted nucleic acid-binding protein
VKTGMVRMAAKAFVDTNILLRAMIPVMIRHQEADLLIQQMWAAKTELWINGQVIREFIVQATHPKTLPTPMTIEQAVNEIDAIKRVFQVADETAAVRDKLIQLIKEYPTQGKQIHDANLVATMLAYGIDTLLTFNIDDFKRFGDKIKLVSPPPL